METAAQEMPSYKHVGNANDPEYDAFLARLQTRFLSHVGGGAPLFETDAEGLFEGYLSAFPPEVRTYHNCHSCRHFVERYGHLVVVDEDGRTKSALWNEEDAPDIYKASVRALARAVARAPISRPFLNSLAVWGQPHTGIWTHLAVTPPAKSVYKGRGLTAGQAAAEKKEDFGTVSRALAEFAPEHVALAVKLLKSNQMYRGEKVLGPAEWLQKLHADRARVADGEARKNVTWLAVATAPAGFCHPRSSMIGTLLEDIAAGKAYDDVARSFAAKMNPLSYQRSQSAPSAGTVRQAEQVFEKMGIAGALRRRFARLDDLVTVWRPGPPIVEETPVASDGIFSHLTPKQAKPKAPPMRIPPQVITWEKFARDVLPGTVSVECFCPPSDNGYAALVTACDPDALPVLQWDRPEQRNPVSWYTHRMSQAEDWNLTPNAWAKVTAITLQPNQWYEPQLKHQGEGVLFVLDGALDVKSPYIALFPETLISELHGVRSVIEEFARTATLEDAHEGSACGLLIQRMQGNPIQARLRVTDKSGAALEYHVDRLD